jgi:hypothetical protein
MGICFIFKLNCFEMICRNYFNISILKFSGLFKIPYGISLDFLGQHLLECKLQGMHYHLTRASILGVKSLQAVGFLEYTIHSKLNLSLRRAVIGMVRNCRLLNSVNNSRMQEDFVYET